MTTYITLLTLSTLHVSASPRSGPLRVQADGQLIDMMASFKAVLIYFGKREAEAETDQEKFEEVLAYSYQKKKRT